MQVAINLTTIDKVNLMRRFKYFILVTSLSFVLSVVSAATVVPSPPKIKASSYLVMDHLSGDFVIAENMEERVEPASLTKMMTAYVVASELAAGNINLNSMVTISEKAWRMKGSRMFIEVNKKVAVEDLLKGVIVQSGNDASVALAEYVAGSEDVFAQVMNQYAARLGMNKTNFTNSTGLPDESHYTTAKDMALLASALVKDYPDIYALHAIKEFTFNGIKQHNRNRMLWGGDGVDGIKTGYTKIAGYCLVASAKREDMRLISVIMGAEGELARILSSQSILSFAFRFYETHKLYEANEVIKIGKIWKGDGEDIALGVSNDLYITIPRGTYHKLNASIELEPKMIAPINRGEERGKLQVSLKGKELINKPLIALITVAEGSFLNRLKDDIRLLFE